MAKPFDRDKSGKVWWARDSVESDFVFAVIVGVVAVAFFVAYLLL